MFGDVGHRFIDRQNEVIEQVGRNVEREPLAEPAQRDLGVVLGRDHVDLQRRPNILTRLSDPLRILVPRRLGTRPGPRSRCGPGPARVHVLTVTRVATRLNICGAGVSCLAVRGTWIGGHDPQYWSTEFGRVTIPTTENQTRSRYTKITVRVAPEAAERQ